MARQKSQESEVRKLTRIGKHSLALTIPIEVARALGWRERQKVVVRRAGRHLIVKDWKR